MSSKFARLKILYISYRSWTPRLSPIRKFLKKAKSLLKVAGILTEFLGELPICPRAVGGAKHPTLITYLVPVESAPLVPFVGSQIMFGRALTVPPVKSVIIVQRVAEVWIDPGGQVCPELIAAVPAV